MAKRKHIEETAPNKKTPNKKARRHNHKEKSHKVPENPLNELAKNKKLRVHHSGNKKRPDMVFLLEAIVVFILLIGAIRISPYIFKDKLPYTKEELENIKKLNITNFSMEEIAKIEMELKSLEDYKEFFNFEPFSEDATGNKNIQASAVMLPMVSFILVFVVPPIVGAYLVWFIIKYWKIVFIAVIEFMKMIIEFSTKAIEGMLAQKWWIRKFTHWHKHSPSFGSYFDKWKRKYVDRPIYKEQMKYAKTYFKYKRIYWDIPYRKHITVPKERLAIKLEFAKKLYITRALDTVFTKVLNIDKHPSKIKKADLINHLNAANNADIDKSTAQAFAQLKQTSAALSGKQIKINDNKTAIINNINNKPLNDLKKNINKNSNETIEHFVNNTNLLYDMKHLKQKINTDAITYFITIFLFSIITIFIIYYFKLYNYGVYFYLFTTIVLTFIIDIILS
jgi:hypothetical protein